MRAVLDTNVVISGLFWKGAPRTLLEGAARGLFRPVTSPSLLAEFEEVLAGRFRLPAPALAEALAYIRAMADVVPDGGAVPEDVRDPGDRKVLACARTGTADAVVTGDKDLLALRGLSDIRILTVREFRDLLRA
jgi:putative PIN family toxin of toxin-antitoxin system